jgi:hypothetical protein
MAGQVVLRVRIRHGEVVDARCVAAAFSRSSAEEARGTSATVTTGSGEPGMASVDLIRGLRWLRRGCSSGRRTSVFVKGRCQPVAGGELKDVLSRRGAAEKPTTQSSWRSRPLALRFRQKSSGASKSGCLMAAAMSPTILRDSFAGCDRGIRGACWPVHLRSPDAASPSRTL